MKKVIISTTINAFAAADLFRSKKASERSGTSAAGSFFRPKSLFGLLSEWCSMVFGYGMNNGALREVLSKGSKIRIITEDSLHPEFV